MAHFENEDDFSWFLHSFFSKNDLNRFQKPQENSQPCFQYIFFTFSPHLPCPPFCRTNGRWPKGKLKIVGRREGQSNLQFGSREYKHLQSTHPHSVE
jgi:hypothetical protein